MELILDCRRITAREALAIGAINKVVSHDRLRDEAIAWAAHIAQWPSWAFAAAKRSLVEGRDLALPAALRNEYQIFAEVARRPDALSRLRDAQAKYDAGADSFAVLGLPRPSRPVSRLPDVYWELVRLRFGESEEAEAEG